MSKSALILGTLAFVGMAGMSASDASAQSPFGVHIGGRAVHVDLGNPHGNYRSYNRSYARSYSRSSYRAPVNRGHYDFHDTSHYDYHRPQVVRHGNHYDRTPGHYDLHRTGHFDYHRPAYNRGFTRHW